MSDYGELVKQLDAIAYRAVTPHHFETINSAARAIESLLAEKASARDEALEEAAREIVALGMGWTMVANAIRALRSPAKEKAEAK